MEERKGLILEGGAMRGMFTCGVLDVFMENGIEFDGMIGVSAGATFGCNFKSKQAGRALRYNKKYGRDKRYGSFESLIKTGDYYGAEFCYKTLVEELDPFDYDTFENNPMEFWCVATDLETGKAVYHKCKNARGVNMEWIRASASMPLFSSIVEIGGRKLLDGGVGDSIPLRFFEHKGYKRNVVVTTQPLTYVKGETKLLPVIHGKYKAYPEFVRSMATRHLHYNAETTYIRARELEGEAFVIRPDEPLNISHTEKRPEELERVYNIGRATAEAKLTEIKEFLTKTQKIV